MASRFVRWTEEEKETLRVAFKNGGGIKAGAKALPHRSRGSVARMSYILRLTWRRRHWTEAEQVSLRNMWGFSTMDEICRALNRPAISVYTRAKTLGLKTHAPEGWELISEASRRAGYDNVTMRRILRWAGVEMPRAYTETRSRKKQHRIVDPGDVDEAVAAYVRTETVHAAAKRHGMGPRRLAPILARWGVKWVRSDDSRKSHRRVDFKAVDEAIDKHEKWLRSRVRMTDAASRLGISRTTLASWLRKHGVVKRNRREPVDAAEVDRIVALEIARGDDRVPIRGRKPRPPKLAA